MSRVLTFHYVLRSAAGELLDTSRGGEPIAYLEGAGQIIEGLETRLREAEAGWSGTVAVPADAGYGLPDPDQVQRVPLAALPIEGELSVGDRFQTGPEPGAPIVRVVALEGDQVVLDANHPLAGVDLVFEVEVMATREATAEELAHGHAHGPGGHGHADEGCGSGCGCK